MSTKSTLAYDDDFHFYQEMFDDHHVYLEMTGMHYEAGYNRVMVPIPVHIWEVIRKRGAPDLSLADLTDEQLEAKVMQEVDQRAAQYQEALAESKMPAETLALLYGSSDDPREKQIAQALEECRECRRDQKEVKDAIEKLEAKNARLNVYPRSAPELPDMP